MRTENFLFRGTIKNQIKQMELQKKFQLKNKYFEDTSNQNPEFNRIQEQQKQHQKSQMLNAIEAKLRAGKDITNEELEYLKTEHPELYREAIEIKREKETYVKALRQCRNKEEVDRLYQQKTQKYLSYIKGKGSSQSISLRMQAIMAIHSNFMRSRKYQALPNAKQKKQRIKTDRPTSPELNDLPVFDRARKQAIAAYSNNSLLYQPSAEIADDKISSSKDEAPRYEPK